jgi:hypothetical protein
VREGGARVVPGALWVVGCDLFGRVKMKPKKPTKRQHLVAAQFKEGFDTNALVAHEVAIMKDPSYVEARKTVEHALRTVLLWERRNDRR